MYRIIFLLFHSSLVSQIQADRPNVVLVFIDDMGWGDFSCFGNTEAETPNVDRLAQEGIRFEQFYVIATIIQNEAWPSGWIQKRQCLRDPCKKTGTPPVTSESGTWEVKEMSWMPPDHCLRFRSVPDQFRRHGFQASSLDNEARTRSDQTGTDLGRCRKTWRRLSVDSTFCDYPRIRGRCYFLHHSSKRERETFLPE